MENVALRTRDSSQNVALLTRSASAPTITTTTLDDGEVGTGYAAVIVASGSYPITAVISAGALPAWAAFDGNTATITGTPTAPSVTTFTVRISNAYGSDEQQLTLTVPNGYSATGTIAAGVVPMVAATGAITIQGHPAEFTSNRQMVWYPVTTTPGDWTRE